MYYTEEQIKRLKELCAIEHFNTVIDSSFKRGTSSALDNEIADIYEAASGTKVSRTFTCKSCVYNLYLKAGKLYRDSVEYYKQEKMKKAREAKTNNKGNKDKK